jgi:hypothetical protein
MKVMSVVSLVLVVNCIRLSMELLWRSWRLSLHTTPVFRGYVTVSCGYAFMIPPYLAIFAHAGIRAFNPALVWCFVMWLILSLTGMAIVILEGGVGQTAELMFALNPQKGKMWKQRSARAVLGSSAALVGGFTLAGLFLNSVDESTRHQGAALMYGLTSAHFMILVGVSMWAQREQQGMRAKMGQRSAEELKSGTKAMKVVYSSAILLVPLFLVMSVPSGRELFGTTLMLAFVPFAAIMQSVAALVRVKNFRRQMTASMKVVPTLVRSAFDDQRSIASTIRQYTQQRSLRRRKITVRESGVTLQFLEQLYAENQISENATANDVVSQHVKPHTKDVGGQGSSTFVELVQEGETNSVRWCGVPTHMVSYSWKYTLAMMIDILHKFELENPPAVGTSYRYYIDQFALDQHGFGKALGSEKAVQDRMLEQLNESIAVPGKMLCMLHPW